MMSQGRVLVPVRGVFEHMNAQVTWHEASRTVIAFRGADEIRLPLNSHMATVNGRQVHLDSPATSHRGRTVVPLRFLSESLGATVDWIATTRTVEITTTGSSGRVVTRGAMTRISPSTVIPFQLDQKLSSAGARKGDRFTARLDTSGSSGYQGLVSGAVLEGHVDAVRAKDGSTPGVLGLAFDRIRMPDGSIYPVRGSLISLDSKSVENVNGRLVARPGAKTDNLKYVGYGAGAGALVAILTKGNVLSTTVIGAALGYLYGEVKRDPAKINDVSLAAGTKFGVRLTDEFAFRSNNH